MTQFPELDSLTTQPCGCQVYAAAGLSGTEYPIRYCRLHNAAGEMLKALRGVRPVLESAILAGLEDFTQVEIDEVLANHGTLKMIDAAIAAAQKEKSS